MPVILPLKPLGVKHSYHAASLLRALFFLFFLLLFVSVSACVYKYVCYGSDNDEKKKTPSGIGSFRKALAFLVSGVGG